LKRNKKILWVTYGLGISFTEEQFWNCTSCAGCTSKLTGAQSKTPPYGITCPFLPKPIMESSIAQGRIQN